ncbi:MAG: ADP-ribosylglycohydrolase family protein, partial [Dongiaceae bacterium]
MYANELLGLRPARPQREKAKKKNAEGHARNCISRRGARASRPPAFLLPCAYARREARDKHMTRPLLALLLLSAAAPAIAQKRLLPKESFLDKVRGGWAGQMIGVVYGAPTEFRARGVTYDGERRGTPAELKDALNQDDLYVEMTFAEVMDRYGLEATPQLYAEAFRDSKYALWHANLLARRNLARGIMPPLSGDPRYNPHANDIDFQIEADFIGLMSPGLPRAAQDFAWRI